MTQDSAALAPAGSRDGVAGAEPSDVALLEVSRGGYVESVHRGRFVLLAADGSVAVERGDVAATVFPRSSLKPVQAATMVSLGYPGRGPALALAAASHDAEPVHVAQAREILGRAGLSEAALQCPPALPASEAALVDWVRSGRAPSAVCHNCSGKHAAMLATCVAAGWPIESYRDPAHPLQQAIAERLGVLAAAPVGGPVVDGCGAPAFAIPLSGLAAAYRTLAAAEPGPEAEVAAAMRAHPLLLGGSARAVTQLAAAVPGLVAKEGAEGVWAAALPDGRAFAAKIADGSARGLGPLLATVLRYWGFDAPAIAYWANAAVLGGGVPVGEVAAAAPLREALGG